MFIIDPKLHEQKRALVAGLESARQPWWSLWRELANYYLPRRYTWLLSRQELETVKNAKNPFILDGTGTRAARTLASGMMNGITSPARPWFRLRIAGFDSDADHAAGQWLDEVVARMLVVLSISNFYNAMGVMYLDLSIFGSSAMLIYEDYRNVIRCFNPCLGEFYLGNDSSLKVNTFARKFHYTVMQTVQEFGIENCSEQVQRHYKEGGARLTNTVPIMHLIEPNFLLGYGVPGRMKFRECYWEIGAPIGKLLRVAGYNEMPGVFPRWELNGTDTYGTSPAMDALGDVIQLQHETAAKGKGLDMMNRPPMLADITLKNKPLAMIPGGVTFVANLQNSAGAKPVHTFIPPVNDIRQDIIDVQARIRETFHNDLFTMISQLDTVRSAAEIYERKEEKLVLLGPVLERFEHEALDPALHRVYEIMGRANLLPPVPESLRGKTVEIQYVSVLDAAQNAVAAVPVERWLQLIGMIAPVRPDVLDLPNWDELIRGYGKSIGIRAKDIRDPRAVDEERQQRNELNAQREAMLEGQVLVEAGQTLSETDVGGGANALQRLLGS